MNRFTLRFKNLENEEQFGIYMKDQLRDRGLSVIILSQIISVVIGINEMLELHILLASICLFWCVMSIGIYIWIQRNEDYYRYFPLALSWLAFQIPYLLYFFFIINGPTTFTSNNYLLWISNLTINYLLIYQHFIVYMIVYLNLIIMNTVTFYTLFGFHIYLPLYLVHSLFALTIAYKNIQEKRLLYLSSQVNQSTHSIINNCVTDKLITFDYDEHTIKYRTTIYNKEASEFFQDKLKFDNELGQDDKLSSILANIYIQSRSNAISLNTYLYKRYLRAGQVISNINEAIVMQGYIRIPSQKISIELFVQAIPKLQFIIRFQDLTNQWETRRNQILFLTKYQLITQKLISSIANTLLEIRQFPKCVTEIKRTLGQYETKLQLTNVLHSTNYKLTFNTYDIISQLMNQIQCSNIKIIENQINIHNANIKSDRSLTGLLFKLLLNNNRKHNKFISIYVNDEISPGCITFGFEFQQIDRYIGHLTEIKWEYFRRILSLVGDPKTAINKPFKLRFDILIELETRLELD